MEVALGRAPGDAIEEALATRARRGIAMAPAEGLFLAAVPHSSKWKCIHAPLLASVSVFIYHF